MIDRCDVIVLHDQEANEATICIIDPMSQETIAMLHLGTQEIIDLCRTLIMVLRINDLQDLRENSLTGTRFSIN
jgi:hypothetical protein